MRRRKPPAVSPKARVRPVTMMMITATILETGPSIDCRICWSGCSHGMLDPAANADVARRFAPTKTATAKADKWRRTNARIMGGFLRKSGRPQAREDNLGWVPDLRRRQARSVDVR